jgi:hypothetical protein
MFPTGLGCSLGDGTPGLFGTPGVTWPHVPIQTNAAPALQRWFASNDNAGGATPLISTIEWFADNVDRVWSVPENGYLLVMTEGADTCTCSNDTDPRPGGQDRTECLVENGSAATRALVARGVKVYVIGYNYSEEPEALNAIASNGGTSITEFVPAGGEAGLTNAFEAIVSDAKLCQ